MSTSKIVQYKQNFSYVRGNVDILTGKIFFGRFDYGKVGVTGVGHVVDVEIIADNATLDQHDALIGLHCKLKSPTPSGEHKPLRW